MTGLITNRRVPIKVPRNFTAENTGLILLIYNSIIESPADMLILQK